MNKISVVINTLNEEANIERAISSVKWADEIVLCDMYSDDKTVLIAKRLGAQIYYHKKTGFVEPARNYAISKAKGDWILILDADEEINKELQEELVKISQDDSVDYLKIPRKNIIFNKWMRNACWWPDFNIRFFKKGSVKWNGFIHRPPEIVGIGHELPPREELAIVHYHYTSVGQFIERMNRYTDVQAKELIDAGYRFSWRDILEKPLSEFLSRYFAGRGYQDGLHGLALSLLQGVSFLVMYLKIWDKSGFVPTGIPVNLMQSEVKSSSEQIRYWLDYVSLSPSPIKAIFQKIHNKFKK